MSHRNLNLPEPSLPERELIADAAPVPELSAGFKSRVMAECGTSIAIAKRTFRMKVAGTTAGLCCLGLLVYLSVPHEQAAFDGVVGEQPAAEQPAVFHPSSESGPSRLAVPSGASSLSVDQPGPTKGTEAEKQQMNQIIEDLSGRKKMFDGSIMSKF